MPKQVDFDTAFRSDVDPASGGWRASEETVRRKVSALTRNFSSMWVGIASNGSSGMRDRWNAKYKGLGMTSIACVYTTTSDSFRKEMEKSLTSFYGTLLDNAVGGGGGSSGTAPYAVYVAWKWRSRC